MIRKDKGKHWSEGDLNFTIVFPLFHLVQTIDNANDAGAVPQE